MNPDTINITYEAISNPILRLLIYFLAAAVGALVSGIVLLFRTIRSMVADQITSDRENAAAMNNVADALENLNREVAELRGLLYSRHQLPTTS